MNILIIIRLFSYDLHLSLLSVLIVHVIQPWWLGSRVLHKLHDSVLVDQSPLGACMIIWYQWTLYVMYILDVCCVCVCKLKDYILHREIEPNPLKRFLYNFLIDSPHLLSWTEVAFVCMWY